MSKRGARLPYCWLEILRRRRACAGSPSHALPASISQVRCLLGIPTQIRIAIGDRPADHLQPTVIVQFQGREVELDTLAEAAKADFRQAKKRTPVTDLKLYSLLR